MVKTVAITTQDPVNEAVKALKDGVEYLSLNFWGIDQNNYVLSECKVEYPQIENAGLKTIVNELKENKSCTSLDLNGNNIGGGKTVQKLAKVLATNETLKELSLNNNKLTTADVGYLAEALKSNKTLEELRLDNNKITDTGLVALSKVLRNNSTLKILTLNKNQIQDVGAKAAAEMLKVNQGLEILSLNYNLIYHGGGKALLRSLKENTSLTYLGMAGNKLNGRVVEWCKELFNARKESGRTDTLQLSLDHNKQVSASDYEKICGLALLADVQIRTTLYQDQHKRGTKNRVKSLFNKERHHAVWKGYARVHN